MKKWKYFSLFILVMGFFTFAGMGQIPEQLFKEGEAAYREGNFVVAVEKYENILKTNVHSSELYYDLGNAYFKLNQVGKAIVFYERAALLTPNDEDLQHNLSLARAKITDDVERPESFFLIRWFQYLRTLLPLRLWNYIALFFLWSAAAGVSLWLTGAQRKVRKWGFIAGVFFFILSFFPFGLAYSATEAQKNSGAAVIVVAQTALKSAPDEAGKTEFTLREGVKIFLSDQIGPWYKVKLSNGDIGWVAENALEKI